MSDTTKMDDVDEFISFLFKRASEKNPWHRAFLAKLRRNVGHDTPDAAMLGEIAAYLPDHEIRRKKFELVATLFALHPAGAGSGNFGDTMKKVGEHESAVKRFVAILDSDEEDLPHRMRQAVSLARSQSVPIRWDKLLTDLLSWNSDDRWVQYSWARAYWGRNKEQKKEPVAAESGVVGA